MKNELKVLVNDEAATMLLKSVDYAKDGDTLYLANPQHINYASQVKYKSNNKCHQRYKERGLLFESEIDAVMYSMSVTNRGFNCE